MQAVSDDAQPFDEHRGLPGGTGPSPREPLSNLDAKLRVQIRAEIAALQKQLGVTTLYVTHDQVEAMTMGDRVVVMKNGRLMHCARPSSSNDDPVDVFVAGFIGSPRMNLFQSTLQRDNDGALHIRFGPQEFKLDADFVLQRPRLRDYPTEPITVGIRPEGFTLAPHADAEHSIDVDVSVIEMLGSETLVYFVAPVAPVESASDADVRDRAQASDEEESILAGSGATVMCARLAPPVSIADGANIRLTIDTRQLYFFDAAGVAVRDNN
jgi:multiple sugar transport system ATP-binding protein